MEKYNKTLNILTAKMEELGNIKTNSASEQKAICESMQCIAFALGQIVQQENFAASLEKLDIAKKEFLKKEEIQQ